MRTLFVILSSLVSLSVSAQSAVNSSTMSQPAKRESALAFEPYVSAGWRHQNDAQDHMEFGASADLAYALGENFRLGFGTYLSLGEKPHQGFEYGGGPYVSYVRYFKSRFTFGLRQDILGGVTEFTSFDEETQESDRMEEKFLVTMTSPFVGALLGHNFWVYGSYRFLYSLERMHTDIPASSSLLSLVYCFE